VSGIEFSEITCVNTEGSVALAEDNRDFVLGFVCQSRVSSDQSFIHFTPGMLMLAAFTD